MKHKILVSGSRHWTDSIYIYDVLSQLLDEIDQYVLIEGEAEGVDIISKWAAKELSIDFDPHQAKWYQKGKFIKSAGLDRNIEMLNLNPIKLLAFHEDISVSRGTRHCIVHALKRDIPVTLYTYDEVGNRKVVELSGSDDPIKILEECCMV